MHDLISMVRLYRLTTGLAERLRLANDILTQTEPSLRGFVFHMLNPQVAEDVLQEVLTKVFKGLGNFRGNSEAEFLAWARGIARFTIYDQYTAQTRNRVDPTPIEELQRMMDVSAAQTPISPAVRHDLDYAMKLLTATKPECYDFLWKHYVFGLDYGEIAEEQSMNYDNVRMKIGRCLNEAKSLVS